MDAVEMHEPYTYLNGLTVSDLEDLLEDINVYEKIDLNRNRDFWNDIITIVNDITIRWCTCTARAAR